MMMAGEERAISELVDIARAHLGPARDLFAAKRVDTREAQGVWNELVYCILAGTQVPAETAGRARAVLLQELGEGLRPEVLGSGDMGEAVASVQACLRMAGYRFHRTKARTIVMAAQHCRGLGVDLRRFVDEHEVKWLERDVVTHVHGIGKKIANHWLRNVGKDTCTVDLHLKRLFRAVGLFSGMPNDPLSVAEFERLVNVMRAVASAIGRPLGEVQYALWLAARRGTMPGGASLFGAGIDGSSEG